MTARFGPLKTFSMENRMSITCPVFGVETELRACFKLDEMVMKGQRPAVRKGCQVAMGASKCPIWHIKNEMRREESDPYFSPELKHGALSGSILSRIAPVLVLDSAIDRAEISDGEKAKLRACNEAARQGVKPLPTRKSLARQAQTLESVEAEPSVGDDLVEAAMTGDLTAAINEATKELGS